MKYLSMIALLIWLAASFWGISLLRAPAAGGAIPPQQDVAQQRHLLQQQLQAITDDQARLRGLHRVGSDSRYWPDLVAMVASTRRDTPLTESLTVRDATARKLSMIYVSQGFHRAVIDGAYVAPGALLPGGARVSSIEADRVVVREPWGDQVLRLSGAGRGGE